MTALQKDNQKELTVPDAWDKLYDFVESCISWNSLDLDYDKFIEYGRKNFIVKTKPKKE